MKNYYYLLTLLCFITGSVNAQISIEGEVTNTEGDPILGANVLLTEANGTMTNNEGTYRFTNVKIGEYVLKVSFLGFKPQEKKILVKQNKDMKFDFVLTTSSEQLQEVEITGRKEKSYKNNVTFAATKTATAIKDIPQAVSYVTKEVFADQQAYRVNDIVKNISGVNTYSYYDDFTFRGFRSGDTYINGLRVVGLFGPEPLLANIERVEVIKGPASAMFGNSIPGGIMNRVTKKPLTKESKAINFTLGSFNTLRTTADFTGAINEKKTLLYRLNLAYENSDSFRNIQEYKSYVIAPSISFLPTSKTRINFDLVITNFDGKLDRGQPIFGATSGSDIYATPISFAIGATNDYHQSDVVYSTLSLSHQFSDKLSFNASYIKYLFDEDLQEHRTSNQFAIDGSGNSIPTSMGMMVIKRQGQTIADNLSSYFVYKENTGTLEHKIVAGVDYNQQKSPIGNAQSIASGYLLQGGGASSSAADFSNFQLDANGNPIPNVPHFDLQTPTYSIAQFNDYIYDESVTNPTKYFTYGFYVQDQIKWNKFQLLLGGRQEYYNDIENYDQTNEKVTTQHKFLPRVGMVYAATSNINVYGTYTESFQPQGVASLNNPQAGGPFDPVNAFMLETGAKGEFFNKRLSANLALYFIENNNILVNANDTSNPDLLIQRGQEQSKGVELDVNGRILPNLSITANYAYNEAIITESDNASEVGEYKENAPLHQGGIFGKYTFIGGQFKGIGLTLGSNFVGKRNTREATLQLPSYMVVDAGVSYKVDKFNIQCLVNNIGDKTHWVGGYSYTRLYPGKPRNFLLSVGYTF
ncbi:iron complex outermembrane receptor protein [Wenyingzhuangia heitensis]|uniref:Iron complex outermembrane receptor protein n=1 Tax=Wenyingzhuangia heitensis TaxID=1487859 RepID=A0ABX0UBB1_9FLAO|nr:TonB-dependent receptor [Wenyingzhuangia heitensis]NIJ44446.1 iron complex outermembrane receptor protein [Wenyingzhuangia heitensis]